MTPILGIDAPLGRLATSIVFGPAWSDKEVNRYLEKIMVKAFREVREQARKYKTHMRTGAFCLAVDRVAKATSVRGIFP